MPRPRAFDIDIAVDRALDLFWRQGYEGTTLDQLTEAMEINRPSLYSAFGSKEGLFLRVLERYAARPGAGAAEALGAETAREAAFRLLRFYADAAGITGRPKGCMLVQSALVTSEDSQSVRTEVGKRRCAVEAALAARLAKAKREGELPDDTSAGDLARYIWTICEGLSVQAVDGASREQLRRVVDVAMKAWPA